MKLVFAGTPAVAVPPLERLLRSDHDVVAVVTRPDAPAGRGRTLQRSPVAEVADAHGIEVLTPVKAGDPEFLGRLSVLAPDLVPVVAYGNLVPPSALVVPVFGWINLHFSLLPAWRGAAPVQHAILHGDELTGAAVFQLEKGLDTGPVFGQLTEVIRPDDTAGALLSRLSDAGAELLAQVVDGIAAGALAPVPQPDDGISLAPKLTADDAHVDWAVPAFAIDRRVRACTPAPGAWTTFRGARIKLGPVRIARDEAGIAPGALVVERKRVLVGTATDPVVLGDVVAPGKKPMPATDWARGARPESGDHFE
ncbi:methionyl-tRNA formyltransferase [Cryptosporangium phraense]|uniref:Methionyl-tRNA formyltransferase n=1 Tax=Cryptosporangium phraense TaxID=2593070 RepID=A0A545AJZ1_9ACTN|nr:methionyl-tRNA formyltransferase [Cryptosporangium phraense]TQS41638.1 methionyl-tRNA formyltransferase [Cryptosporangium phraense]